MSEEGQGTPAPEPAAEAAPPPPPPTGKVSWKDKLKSAATQAATQGKQLAEQAKDKVAEQQAKRIEQWQNDPETLWFSASHNPATKATGVSKAFYRLTKDRIWIETGVLGTRSEYVPLWAVKDIDVRQSLTQRGKDIGDVLLYLDDPSLATDPSGAFSFSGEAGGGHTSGEVLLDNIEGPHALREQLLPLVSEARQKKTIERQSQYVHHMTPPAAAAPPPPPAAAAEPVDLADQLKKLAELRDQGILTDEEFAAQKAKLLG